MKQGIIPFSELAVTIIYIGICIIVIIDTCTEALIYDSNERCNGTVPIIASAYFFDYGFVLG